MDQVAFPFDALPAPVMERPVPPAPISETRLRRKRGPGTGIARVQRIVARQFGVRRSDLSSEDRHKSIAFARHVAMYVCKQHLKCSFPEIGRAFGDRDHTTVMSAVRKIESQLASDRWVRAHMDTIKRRLAKKEAGERLTRGDPRVETPPAAQGTFLTRGAAALAAEALAEQVEEAAPSPWDPEDRISEKRERDKLLSGFYLEERQEEEQAEPEDDIDEGADEEPVYRRIGALRRRDNTMPPPKAIPPDEVRRLVVIDRAVVLPLSPAEEALRPKTRGECMDGPRPCIWAMCPHHLAFDKGRGEGAILENFPGVELDKLPHTCALDMADDGEHTLEEIGEVLNVSRERIRQIVEKALRKLERLRDVGELRTSRGSDRVGQKPSFAS